LSTEQNKAIVRRYREIYNSSNLDTLEEVLAADFIAHNLLPGLPPGIESAKLVHQVTMATWPDQYVTTEDLIAEGDRVVERWTQTQTHTGAPVFGAPANTGKKLRVTGISIYRIANGKIVEHWAESDLYGVMVQLGLIPVPGQAAE
jgi:predicted ester cyclase